jgi:hypothetical protein
MPWDKLMVLSKRRLQLSPAEFWKLTFGEFWPMYNAELGKVEKPMTYKDLSNLEEAWINGNTRGISSQSNG